jgi:hypothetical protein
MKKKAVVFIAGQSNAHAHNQGLAEVDRIAEPMTNVFSLDRDPNQAYDRENIVWSGFTTAGKNLGESQDHTASMGYHLARLWQDAINRGTDLPDLYIVQISVGSQGIINGMWNPDRERILIPGPLGTVKIALFPLAQQIYRLVMADIPDAEVLGLHWIGCEQEIWHNAWQSPQIDERYDHFFDALLSAIGTPCPVYFYETYLEPCCRKINLPLEAAEGVNRAIYRQVERLGGSLVRAKDSPYWDPEREGYGIFAPDNGHYLATVQGWFARKFFDEIWRRRGK